MYTAHSSYFIHDALICLVRQMSEWQKQHVTRELKQLGVRKCVLIRAESQGLAYVLHENEHVKGVAHGRYENGFAMLVATDRRVLFIDRKPLFMRAGEVGYDLVGSMSYGKVGFFAAITLRTRIGDYKIRTMNFACARHFMRFVKRRCVVR